MHEPVPANPELFRPLKEGRVNQVERFFNELLWCARPEAGARRWRVRRSAPGCRRRSPREERDYARRTDRSIIPAKEFRCPTFVTSRRDPIDQALSLLHADPGAAVLAGGTDLLIQCRTGAKRPTAFIDLKRIPQLVGIKLDDRWLHIGAATCAADITAHRDIKRLWPGIVDAVHLIGSTQIQGRGTLGGNLCNASPAADATCALIVNQAICVIAGPACERLVPVEQFCLGPGKTVLERDEILVELRIPRPAARTADAYLRLIPRTEMDIAVAGAGVSVTLDAAGLHCGARRVPRSRPMPSRSRSGRG